MLSEEQVNTIAQAVMASDKERQRIRAIQREEAALQERSTRQRAVIFLCVTLVGGLMAYWTGIRIPLGMLCGGAAAQLAMLVFRARRHRVETRVRHIANEHE
jgi:hypothetical protein